MALFSLPIAKNFSKELLEEFADRMSGEPGDLLLFVADTWEVTCKALAGLRKRIGAEMNLYNPDEMHFSWVVEFPMFEHDAEEDRWYRYASPIYGSPNTGLGTA